MHWKIFYYEGREVLSYTMVGTFPGEEEATKELIADDLGVSPDEIITKVEVRDRHGKVLHRIRK